VIANPRVEEITVKEATALVALPNGLVITT
jgi:hypothetical protein